ncbi:MAG: colanic acid biosynthesis acetyltransferase WcaF [Phycisphaeraceae bacterium]|nr:hypothetical protein [Phycisphaerales bacterium]MCB9859843.1 colanic acid biosynthesis acetyltransferase WcaF [Phycisphaeraceae bacterium]
MTDTHEIHAGLLRRLFWSWCGMPAFRCTFHNWYRARGMVLNIFGARVSRSAKIRPTVRVNRPWNLVVGDHAAIGDYAILDCVAPVFIGARSTISQYAHLCTVFTSPDADDDFPAPIRVEDDCWVAADVFVGAGVTIRHDTVVGSRSSVFDSLPERSICVGDRAKRIGERVWRHEQQYEPVAGGAH